MSQLSLYFKTNRQAYYDHLQRVRTEGDWEGWLRFFLKGVRDTSREALTTAREALAIFEADREKIGDLGRGAGSAQAVFEMLQRHPLTTIPAATDRLDLSYPTVQDALGRLEEIGVVEEVTGEDRGRPLRVHALSPPPE